MVPLAPARARYSAGMGRFVVLYRGINVGGNNPVKMDALRAMHGRLGHTEVANYIQSGNIVLSADGPAAAIAREIGAQFAKSFGFAAHIIVIPAARWRTIVKGNPYGPAAAEQPSLVHAVLCDGKPDTKALAALYGRTATTEVHLVKG